MYRGKNQQWKQATHDQYSSNNHYNNQNTENHNYNQHNHHNTRHNTYSQRPRSHYDNNRRYDTKHSRHPKQYPPNNHHNNRSAVYRAPIEECNHEFMQQIQQQNKHNEPGIQKYRYRYWEESKWQETESLTIGKYFYTNVDCEGNKRPWKKPKEIVDNNDYDETFKHYPWENQVHFIHPDDPEIKIQNVTPFTVTTNTFPIELNESINVLQYDIITQPIISDGNNKKNKKAHKEDIQKAFKQYNQRQMIVESFNPYVISDDGILFTFAKKESEYKKNIEFPKDFNAEYMYSFTLKSVRSLHFYAGMHMECDENEEISPEKRTQIFQLLLSSVLLRAGFKYIRFAPSKGWYPVNSNTYLNHVVPVYNNPRSGYLKNIGVLRGFKASIQTCTNGVALKVSNTNKILHSMTLREELEELYYQDPERYASNIHRFIGRKALYLPTQTVIDITDIHINKDETATFSTVRNGKQVQISHKDNLLKKGVVHRVDKEEYGLITDKRNFSYLPQFVHVLFDQDLSKKQCKDALEFLGKNVDHELESVNHFVSHIINVQNEEYNDDTNDNHKINVLSLIQISSNASEAAAYPLPKMSISLKTDYNTYKHCDELSIKHDWKHIHDVIIPIKYPAKVLLIGVAEHIIRKIRKHMDDYFRRRNFECKFIEFIEEYVLNDMWNADELKKKAISDKYELLVLILPSIEGGSQLKRTVHRLCLELGIASQFISDEVFYDSNRNKQRNVAWGMMSDVVYKLGATTYRLNLANNLRINVNKTMILGLDICHPTRIKSTSRPSIACLTSLYGDIMTPNVSQQKSTMFLNKNRQEVCGYKATNQMMKSVLTQQLLREDIHELPSTIFMFRDGVSDSQIPQMVSKELTACLLAIRQVKKIENIKQKYSDIKEWKPNMEWVVIQKRILDRFSAKDITLSEHTPAFVIPFGDIVSGQYFEFYAQIGKRSPRRVIFIRDDLKLRENGVMDVAQFIYAMHWIYPPCIPFQMGPLNIPAPIKFADHYANIWQDLITYADCSMNDIKTCESLRNPQLVIIDAEDKQND